MKKTLITLLALAGVAMAEEQQLTLVSSGDEDGALGYNETDGCYLTKSNANLNWSEDTGNLTSWKIAFTATSTSLTNADTFFSTTGSGFAVQTENSGTQLAFNWKNKVGLKTMTEFSLVVNHEVDIVLTFVADVQLVDDVKTVVGGTYTLTASTMVADSTTGEETLVSGSITYDIKDAVGEGRTLADAIAASDFEKGGESRLWTRSGENQFSNIALYKLDDNMVVPEPATATLSLLALAGLAARRRRH